MRYNTFLFILGGFILVIVGGAYFYTLSHTHSPTLHDGATSTSTSAIPLQLQRYFPNTDFSKADPRLADALSGGPSRDGIPAIDDPTFVSIQEVDRPDAMQVIVLNSTTTTKVYPYNILTWHEIVNDMVGDTPVAITFCPLCGSAIVYDRTLPNGTVSTFGVSGSLLESNMIMYDRATENLWQQSTGDTLAGSLHPSTLSLVQFQLMTLGDAIRTYPDALILSEDTGHNRDYARNPYAGYETDDRFAFDPSNIDTRFPAKTIMVVFRDQGETFATPWSALLTAGYASTTHNGRSYSLEVRNAAELTIRDNSGVTHPFYFEMWFSVAVQHPERITLVTPSS